MNQDPGAAVGELAVWDLNESGFTGEIDLGSDAGVTKVDNLLVCPEVNRADLRTFLAAATAVIARAVVSGQRHIHAAASRAAIAASLHAYAIGL